MWRALTNIFRLGVKELRSLRSDPVLTVLIVYVFSVAVYMVATGARTEVLNAAVAVVDEDHSELSRRLFHAFLPPYFRPAQAIGADEIDAAMDSGRFVFVIDIPPKFESDVLSDKHPSIQVNVDATAMTQAGNGAVYAQNIIAQEVLGFLQNRDATA